MADTLGGLIDKLITIDTKLWHNQETIYKIRRINYQQFKEQYTNTEEKLQNLYNYLQKICDLNIQRNQLIDEIDQKTIQIITTHHNNQELDNGTYIQRKHKTL